MRKQKEIAPLSPSDKAFFNRLYDENKNFMFYIARKYTTSQPECEDIVQDAVVRLLNNIHSLKELNGCKIRNYIVLTIKTAFLDSERKRREKAHVALDEDVLETLIKAGIVDTSDIPDMSAHMEVERLRRALSPRDWLVLEGKYILGYSQEELGKLIGVSPDSVRMILCRAREKARNILSAEVACGGEKNE